ncbi:xylose isomerase [Phocicoccus schoeneichii]|uniref:xylose isomerase n=1 Tax=Phocicoccus schoeneichii TaxID=1812261 RepID=UPI003D0F2A81
MSYFSNVDKVKYEGVKSDNPFAFRHYNPEEEVLGKTMKEHLRFAVAYWHTITEDGGDPFGTGTAIRNWDGDTPMETAKNRVDAFFELLVKLDVEYFAFHDVDIAPTGDSLEEFFSNLDEITDLIKEKMDETGIKLLWNTQNVFTHPRFVHGAATSNNADVFAYAAAQVKKTIDLSVKLGGENIVFWGGREGYESLLNTDLELELDNMARLLQMAVDYAEKVGHKVQFLLEPKPKEPMTHQYDHDAATTVAFLQKYNLMEHFKLNLEGNHATLAGHTFEHELRVARSYDALGSIDANHAEKMLGWDTDEFPTNIYDTTLTMYEILENGGIAPGGINFDAKVRRTSFEMDDLVLAHIAGMDTFARGLKSAAKMKEEKFLDDIIEKRYASYTEGIGKRIVDNEEDLESLTKYALDNKEIKNESSHLEFIKSRMNDYLV